MSSNDQPPPHPNPTAPLEHNSTPPSRPRFPFNVDAPCYEQMYDRSVYQASPPVVAYPGHLLPPHAFVQPPHAFIQPPHAFIQPPHAFIQPPHAFVPPPPAGTVISSAGQGRTSVTAVMDHMTMMMHEYEMDLATLGSTEFFANESFATLQRNFGELRMFFQHVVEVVNGNMAAAHENVEAYQQPKPQVAERIQEVSGAFKEKIELYSELRSSATAQQSSTTTLPKAPISQVDSWQSEVFKAKHVDLKSGEFTSTSNSNEAASSSTLSQKEPKEPIGKDAEPISAGKKTYAEKVKDQLPSVVAVDSAKLSSANTQPASKTCLQKSPMIRVDTWKADYFKAMNVDLEPGELTNVQFSTQQQPSTSKSHEAASSSTFPQKEVNKEQVEESEVVVYKGKEPTADKKTVVAKAAEAKKAKAKETKKQKEAQKSAQKAFDEEMERERANWLSSLRPLVQAKIQQESAKFVGTKLAERDCKRAQNFLQSRLAIHEKSADHRLIAFYTILRQHQIPCIYKALLQLKTFTDDPLFEDHELEMFKIFTNQTHPKLALNMAERRKSEAEKQEEKKRLQRVVQMYVRQQDQLRSQTPGSFDESALSVIQRDLLIQQRLFKVSSSDFSFDYQTCAFVAVLNELVGRRFLDSEHESMANLIRVLSEIDHPSLRSDSLYLMNNRDNDQILTGYYNLVLAALQEST